MIELAATAIRCDSCAQKGIPTNLAVRARLNDRVAQTESVYHRVGPAAKLTLCPDCLGELRDLLNGEQTGRFLTGVDRAPCIGCGTVVETVPDGLPCCPKCADDEANT